MVAVLAGMLSACGGSFPRPFPASEPAPPPAVAEPAALDAARQAERDGAPIKAAEHYLAYARSLPQERRTEGYELKAAELFLQAGELERAGALLDRNPPAVLTSKLASRRRLLGAELALASGHPEQAVRELRGIGDLPAGGLRQALRLRAQAHEALAQPLEAARARARLDPLLDEEALQKANQRAILTNLGSLPEEVLNGRLAVERDTDLLRWLELSIAMRPSGPAHTADAAERLREWRARHPGQVLHTAPMEMHITIRQPAPGIEAGGLRRLALLLPLSGEMARAGRSIHAGLLSALLQDGAAPAIELYDTEAGHGVADLYQQALAAGAQLVIGPLRKGDVEALATALPLPVPTLALNRPADLPPVANLYRFGLDPTDEVQGSAEQAWLDGHRRIGVLAPESPWGDRLAAGFAAAWEDRGGDIVRESRYDPSQTDFTKMLREFVASRGGEGFDAIFLAALPRHARMIKPQLRFIRASRYPVYATSHVYTGEQDVANDADLNGILFCDAPWILAGPRDRVQREAARGWSDDRGLYPRLFALGLDAYRVATHLATGSPTATAIEGATGDLSVALDGQVHRQLQCARFVKGRAEPVAWHGEAAL